MLQKVGGKFPLSPKSNRCVKGDAINIEDPFTVDTAPRLVVAALKQINCPF